MLCVNTLNTPGCRAAPVALTKDLKVQRGDLAPTNLSPLFTIYARTYQLLLPLFEKYLWLLYLMVASVIRFSPSDPDQPKPLFFPPSQFYLHFATCLLFPPVHEFISIWLCVCFFKCQIALCFCFFVFLCIVAAVIDKAGGCDF